MVICGESTRADLASQSFVKPVNSPFLCYSRGSDRNFLHSGNRADCCGAYSLWDGFQWLRLVRRRIASHTGFYAPCCGGDCPCKGNEPGLEENLAALTNFDYPNYEIYFSLASSLDPALKVIERVKLTSPHPVHIVIAGAAEDCSEKVYNLREAVESLPEKIEVLVFTDSDVRHTRGWLRKLIAPLKDPRIGATTGYRWIIPSGKVGAGGFASAMASAWNASVATLLGRAGENFCWGGGTAIRRRTFEDAHVMEYWNGAASDDFAMTQRAGTCPAADCFLRGMPGGDAASVDRAKAWWNSRTGKF